MADVAGQRGTGNILQTLRRPDIASTVAELEPESAPLTLLLNRLSKRPTVNSKFGWYEDENEPRFDAINNGGGYLSTDTALVVDNGERFAEHFMVLVTRTGELIRVTGVAGDTLTVVRGVGSTAAALLDDDELLIAGVSMMEGDTSRTPRSRNPVLVENYCQIFRTPYAATGSLLASDQWVNPHDWDRAAKKAGIEHAKDQEYSLWFGRPSENLTGEHPRRTSGGFFHFQSTNSTDAGGQLTEAEFFGALRPAFRYGKKTKTGFAAQLPVDVLNAFPRGKLQIQQGENTYGLNVMRYVSPHGTLNLVTHYLFEGAKYGGVIAIVDLDNVAKRYLANSKASRDTHVRENIQENDRDGRKDELLTECGAEFKQERTHAELYGISS